VLFGGPILLGDGAEIPLSPYQSLLLSLVFGHGARGLSRSRAARLLWGTELDRKARHRLSQLVHAVNRRAGRGGVIERRGERILPLATRVECDLLGAGSEGTSSPVVDEEFLALLPPELPTRDLEGWVQGLRMTQERRRESRLRSGSDLKRGEVASAPALLLPREAPRSIAAAPPLVGRGAELSSALTSISSELDRWTTTVVSGEPGIGKSRLLDEIRGALARAGRVATVIRCHEAERPISFNLLGDLLSISPLVSAARSLPRPWGQILEETFPGATERPFPGSDSAEGEPFLSPPRRVYDAMERVFSAGVPPDGLILLIDDFHWSDPGSAAALGFLRRRLPDLPVRIVLTVPTEVAQLDHPASAYLRTLDGRQDRWITLEALTEAEVASLVAEIHPDTFSEGEIREISNLSGGVPLFAIELATDRAARMSPDGPERDSTTEALFRRRQAALTPAADHLLRLVAVFGRPVDRDVLRAGSNMAEEELLRAVAELVHQRFVSVLDDGRITTWHDLIRGAVYRGLPAAGRRMYHWTVADCLLGSRHPPEPGELATHFERGRAPLLAHRYATLAADEASKKGAFQECRQMLELAASTAADPARRLGSLSRLGRLCLLQGDPTAGARHLARAARCATAIGDVATAVDARIRALGALVEIGEETGESIREELDELAAESLRLGRLSTYLDAKDLTIRVADYGFDSSAAQAALGEVDRLDVGGEPPTVRCLRETIRTRHVCYGSPEEAVVAARTALQIAEEHGLSAEFGRAVKRFLVVLGYRGLLDGEEGRRLIGNAKVGFRQTGDQSGLFDVLINFGVWLADTGRLAAAEEYLLEAGAIVRNLEDSPEHAVFMCNMGELYLYRADYLTAKGYFRRAWEEGTLTRRATKSAVAGGLGLASMQTGDLGIVEELDRALPDDRFFLGNPTVDPTPVALFRARRLEVRRSPEAAATLLHQYAESLRDRIVPAWMKVLLAELRLRRKHNLGGVAALANEGRQAAARVGLEVREGEFAAYG